jgi:hypothetical protein
MKFQSLKPLLYRTRLMYQKEYRLIGTSRFAKNINLHNAYPVRVTALA